VKRLLIAGIGSHNPGDALGWQALQALQAAEPHYPGYRADWRHIEHPAVDLLPALRDAEAAVLLDAIASTDGPPVQRLTLEQLLQGADQCSSHGFSVADVLGLAASLGELPEPLLIVGLRGQLEDLLPQLTDQLAQALGQP
jgi:hydrogenase maturation protease